jgi:hypothetical protein
MNMTLVVWHTLCFEAVSTSQSARNAVRHLMLDYYCPNQYNLWLKIIAITLAFLICSISVWVTARKKNRICLFSRSVVIRSYKMINLNHSHIHNITHPKTQHFYKALHIYKERGGYGNVSACPCYWLPHYKFNQQQCGVHANFWDGSNNRIIQCRTPKILNWCYKICTYCFHSYCNIR